VAEKLHLSTGVVEKVQLSAVVAEKLHLLTVAVEKVQLSAVVAEKLQLSTVVVEKMQLLEVELRSYLIAKIERLASFLVMCLQGHSLALRNQVKHLFLFESLYL
jgi:hypothetical protein